MKKVFETPRLHIVGITTDKSMKKIAAMTDEELDRELCENGFYKNREMHTISDDWIDRVIVEEMMPVLIGKRA